MTEVARRFYRFQPTSEADGLLKKHRKHGSCFEGVSLIFLRWQLDRYRHALYQIDLFSLYILFSHFRPRDATRGNSFFQMSSYARANLRITNEKQTENSHEGITWSEMGKQNVQAEKVYCRVSLLFATDVATKFL